MQVDTTQLHSLVKDGYLTMRPHPSVDLVIWNYTPRCQFEHYWTPETLMCRGLITTSAGKIIARSFSKFFNLEEHQGLLPLEPFKVTSKADGSLGILYHLDGKPQISTRGSFTSEQAIRANVILERYVGYDFSPDLTYLFEIIYKENRIVVDYGDMEDLVLLAIIHTETGSEYDIHHPIIYPTFPFPVVKQYDGINDIEQLRQIEEENAEGFVIRFKSGLRLKMKFAEYKRLHKLLTQCTARSIWEIVKNNQTLDDFLERVPDEFYAWVKRTHDDLVTDFHLIEERARLPLKQVQYLPTRKEQAAIITRTSYPGITFAMLDNKPYQEAIWKMLCPEATRPFKIDEEG